jgi:hypothetical protein
VSSILPSPSLLPGQFLPGALLTPQSDIVLHYATLIDFRNYARGEMSNVPDDEVILALSRAERDVDSYAGFIPTDADTGMIFSQATVDTNTWRAIKYATCAQAKYRLYMGSVFFTEQSQYKEVSGDISTTRASRYGPEMKQEFPRGVRVLTGRFH